MDHAGAEMETMQAGLFRGSSQQKRPGSYSGMVGDGVIAYQIKLIVVVPT